jgi:selenocysteine lyase/cysteine desulfurase
MSFDFSPAALDREFPVRRNLVYMNHAAVAPLPRRVAEAITAHVENVRDRGAADWRSWYGMVEATRGKAARFIGAQPAEIAFLPNTSWGLNLVALGFPWKEGDNVVTDDMEFPSNAYPWRGLVSRGVECRIAKSRSGRITTEDIAALVDDRTRVVAVSWVAFHNGWVFPLSEIGALCRERGILSVVDGIQGLGALPIDVAASNVDVLCADAHKWLYGAEGGAVFYVAEGARERVPARAAGWWNTKTEGEYLEHRGVAQYQSARRYEPGTLPTANVAGLGAAIDLLQEMGSSRSRARCARGSPSAAGRSPRPSPWPPGSSPRSRHRATLEAGRRRSSRKAPSSRPAKARSASPRTPATTPGMSPGRSRRSTPSPRRPASLRPAPRRSRGPIRRRGRRGCGRPAGRA